ncbi:MAG: type I 3-dehydroquinate dehydratase [Flavobacteriales bacterium]
MSKVFVCINGKTLKQCQEQAAGKHSAEFRIDLCPLNPLEIRTLWDSCEEWILTLREDFTKTENWKEVFKFVLDLNPVYVDIDSELSSEIKNEVSTWVKNSSADLIFSYHNFQETPEYEELLEKMNALNNEGADVVKIACMANQEEDNLIVMDLYRKHERLVAFCMGEEGRESRVTALFFGEKLTYAAPSQEYVVAPGQLTYEELAGLLNLGFDDE